MQHESRRSVTRRVLNLFAEILLGLIKYGVIFGGAFICIIFLGPFIAEWAHDLTNSAVPVMLCITVVSGIFFFFALLYQHEDRESKLLSKMGYKYLIAFLSLVFILPMFVTRNIDVDTASIHPVFLFYYDYSYLMFYWLASLWAMLIILTFFTVNREE